MNIADLLERAGRRWPHRGAVAHGAVEIEFAELAIRVGVLARRFRELGVMPGDRVVVCVPNSVAFVEALWASFWAGAVAVPVNWHLHPDEVGYIVEHSDARLLVLAEPTLSAGSGVSEHRAVVVCNSSASAAERWDALAGESRSDPLPLTELDGDEPAWIFYTSGTTGRPKGATLTHRNLLGMALRYCSDLSVHGQEARPVVAVHAAMLSHGSGLYLVPLLGLGATNHLTVSTSFDPGELIDLAIDVRATHLAFLAPTMLHRLVDRLEASGDHLDELSSVITGGAALLPELRQRAESVLGPCVSEIYGQGEAPMTITVRPAVIASDDRAPEGSCGRAFTGIDVQIRDPATHAEVAPGDTGEVWVRGDVVMRGYWNDPGATADTLQDGWLRTGDLGHFETGDWLMLTDRCKDVIISGGSNIYPREVEDALRSHPTVVDACVFGVADAEWGEEVWAAVVAADAAIGSEELIDHCRTRLASFKRPKRIVFVDQLPTNATGKVLRRHIAEIHRLAAAPPPPVEPGSLSGTRTAGTR